jgi:predicted Zn-dependent peptidase
MFTIYAASSPQQYAEVIGHIQNEIITLTHESLTEYDVEKAKNQLKGNYILGLDSTSSRMNSMGKSQLMMRRIRTPDEVLESIERVSLESISEIIKYVFRPELMGISAIGDIDFDPKLLEHIQF